jgi:hypothetical protein
VAVAPETSSTLEQRIAVTLLLFPWVGIAPPYHFTENVIGFWDWALPALIIISGSYLNIRFTRKLPLILGWLGGFFVQAVIRSQLFGIPWPQPCYA